MTKINKNKVHPLEKEEVLSAMEHLGESGRWIVSVAYIDDGTIQVATVSENFPDVDMHMVKGMMSKNIDSLMIRAGGIGGFPESDILDPNHIGADRPDMTRGEPNG